MEPTWERIATSDYDKLWVNPGSGKLWDLFFTLLWNCFGVTWGPLGSTSGHFGLSLGWQCGHIEVTSLGVYVACQDLSMRVGSLWDQIGVTSGAIWNRCGLTTLECISNNFGAIFDHYQKCLFTTWESFFNDCVILWKLSCIWIKG